MHELRSKTKSEIKENRNKIKGFNVISDYCVRPTEELAEMLQPIADAFDLSQRYIEGRVQWGVDVSDSHKNLKKAMKLIGKIQEHGFEMADFSGIISERYNALIEHRLDWSQRFIEGRARWGVDVSDSHDRLNKAMNLINEAKGKVQRCLRQSGEINPVKP